jgi:tRNA(fMet)-specific endonuclease VapC
MILLDTDHLTILVNRNATGHAAFVSRLAKTQDSLGVPVIGVEEQCKGWLAKIHRAKDVHQQIPPYERFIALVHFFADCDIAPFQTTAADTFKQLRKQKVRIGSQDLKIAAIALTYPALLLSANLRDFRQVPGLQVENWLET